MAQPRHHRFGDQPEWAEYASDPDGVEVEQSFQLERVPSAATIVIRQRDVKQQWQIVLNGHRVGELVQDENDQTLYLAVPEGALTAGTNRLRIEPSGRAADDVMIGPIRLIEDARDVLLRGAELAIEVADDETGDPLPCRITVVDASNGSLQALAAESGPTMAVRTGVLYCAGSARFGVPPGEYTIFASRGAEYGVAELKVSVSEGDALQRRLTLRHEVPMPGYVAADTHIHTRELSGHGDASVEERVLTIAGEGIELPITTEHNRHSSYREAAQRLGLDRYFTPVVGNEVTTPVGHFNIFPVPLDIAPPDHNVTQWETLFERIRAIPGVQMIILNHPRDIHSGMRPLGPEHHNAASARRLDGWKHQALGMEVINSSAQQTDLLLPIRDWMTLQNRGVFLTPIGGSDAHDVSRYVLGQGRTYVRCDDSDPGNIDVVDAVDKMAAGHVIVSFGLWAEVVVNDVQSGELAKRAENYKVQVNVLGPSWVQARGVTLFKNGVQWKRLEIDPEAGRQGGVKASFELRLPALDRDVHLVALAEGDPVQQPYWPVAKPYQPVSPEWNPQMVGLSGAVWVDADGDGRRTTALDYAQRLMNDQPTLDQLFSRLDDGDETLAVMVADLLEEQGTPPTDSELRERVANSSPEVQRGFHRFESAWRQSQQARVGVAP